MKITTKGRYAIHILYDLAVNGTEHPVSVKEMARRAMFPAAGDFRAATV